MIKKIMVCLAISLLLAAPAFAHAASKTMVQVTGTSQQEVTPDTARISISLSSIEADLEDAKTENTQSVNRVLASLKELGVTQEQIKTNTYQVNPIYSYEQDKLPMLKGFRVTEGLEIRTTVEQAGILADAVTRAGGSEINGIRFETSKETDYKNTALKNAVADALTKAEVIAAALHKKIAAVTLVNETDVFYRPVMFESRLLKANTEGTAPNIPAGKVTVGATVQVTVELE